MSDDHDLIAPGRPPRDDRFLFGDPSEEHSAPEVLAGLQPRHPEIDPESHPTGEWAQRTVRGSLPLLMTGTLAAGVGVTSAVPTHASAAPTPPVTDETEFTKSKHLCRNSSPKPLSRCPNRLSRRLPRTSPTLIKSAQATPLPRCPTTSASPLRCY